MPKTPPRAPAGAGLFAREPARHRPVARAATSGGAGGGSAYAPT